MPIVAAFTPSARPHQSPLVARTHLKEMTVILMAQDHERWSREAIDAVLDLLAAYSARMTSMP
jgi:predicted RNA polymerase sigma factor